MTYTVGLEFLIDEGTGKASTMWTMSTNHVDAYKLFTYAISLALAWLSGLPFLAT